jgi:hypothetical protein
MLKIHPVLTKSELKQFVKFPYQLFKNCPYWVPPLVQVEMNTLSKETNPAFLNAKAALFIARQNNRTVGRIACFINELENDKLNENHARFGWFDFEEDAAICRELLLTAERWSKENGMTLLKGPYGFTQLDRAAVITEGFDFLGTMGTIYNYPYYAPFIKQAGYVKELEWLEARFELSDEFPPRFKKFAKLCGERFGLKTMVPNSRKELQAIGLHLFELLLDTYKDLPGFVPMSDKLKEFYTNRFISFLRPDLLHFVLSNDNEPVGFGLAMPSLSKALQRAKGRRYPFGFLHLLASRKWFSHADLGLIGVREEWRKKGIHSFIFCGLGETLIKHGVQYIRINPMLEVNSHVLTLWKEFEPVVDRRRQTFKKAL